MYGVEDARFKRRSTGRQTEHESNLGLHLRVLCCKCQCNTWNIRVYSRSST